MQPIASLECHLKLGDYAHLGMLDAPSTVFDIDQFGFDIVAL
jgi:hypothetical protein